MSDGYPRVVGPAEFHAFGYIAVDRHSWSGFQAHAKKYNEWDSHQSHVISFNKRYYIIFMRSLNFGGRFGKTRVEHPGLHGEDRRGLEQDVEMSE